MSPSDNPFSDNPYQAPGADGLICQAELINDDSLWRKGNLLVMHKTAKLPNRCVKSNAPTERYLTRSLYWHHPAVFLAILANLLIYIVLALVLRKSATIEIGLSDAWFSKRHRTILIAWVSVLASIVLVIGGIAMVSGNGNFGWLIAAGVFLFFFGAIYGLLGARMVAPTRITDTHVWLKGVCPDFLRELPEWPHTP